MRDKRKLFIILGICSAICLLAASGVLIWQYLKQEPEVTLYRTTEQNLDLYTSGGGIIYPSASPVGETIVSIRVKMPLTYLSQVTLDQTARVHPSTAPSLTLEGKVTNIIQQSGLQADDAFEFWVSIGNKDHLFLPGTSASVRLKRKVRGLVVPRLAILDLRLQNLAAVFVYRNQRVYLQYVRIGGFSNDSVIITGGLSNGDTVILIGRQKLQNGQIVHVQAIE